MRGHLEIAGRGHLEIAATIPPNPLIIYRKTDNLKPFYNAYNLNSKVQVS